MEKLFSISAAACAAAAVVCFWLQYFDGVFVAAVGGCVAWLLSYRAQTWRRVAGRNAQKPEND